MILIAVPLLNAVIFLFTDLMYVFFIYLTKISCPKYPVVIDNMITK